MIPEHVLGRDGRAGVLDLVRSCDPHAQFRPGAPRTRGGEAAPVALPGPVHTAHEQGRVDVRSGLLDRRRCLWRLRGNDHRRAGAQDARLLQGNLGQRVAEHSGVLVVDTRDDGHQRLDDVRGVEEPAQPDLDDGQATLRLGERKEGHRGDHFKRGDGVELRLSHFQAAGRRRDLPRQIREHLILHRLAVDRDTLRKAVQMG